MSYKSIKLFHNSEDSIAKSFSNENMTLINDTDDSEAFVDLNLFT